MVGDGVEVRDGEGGFFDHFGNPCHFSAVVIDTNATTRPTQGRRLWSAEMANVVVVW